MGKRKTNQRLPHQFRQVALMWLRKHGIDTSGIGMKNNSLLAMVAERTGVRLIGTKQDRYEQMLASLGPLPAAAPRTEQIKRAVIPFPAKAHAPGEKKIKAFYDSWDWKRLRYDFLKGKDRRCECCGTSPEHGARMVVDHVKPIRHFWNMRLDPGNLQLLCDDCNMGKGSRDTTDWRADETPEAQSRLQAIKDQLSDGN